MKKKRFCSIPNPPGSLVQILSHPDASLNEAIELATFSEHRFAFYFWAKWTQNLLEGKKISTPPNLVTFDWHQDLVCPVSSEKTGLRKLDLKDHRRLGIFTWEKLRQLNDTHIISAAYLNLIGNIYVLCRQGDHNDFQDEKIIDRYGSIHTIQKFGSFDIMEEVLCNCHDDALYFDIDLDFFTIQNPYNGVGKKFTYLSDKKIKNILNTDRPLIKWLMKRMCGFTIATEPEHSGGLLKANHFLNLINEIYFHPPLFTNLGEQWEKGTKWKHLNL